jgi:translation elongation factor EF-1beta
MADTETTVAEEQTAERPQIPGIIAPPNLDMSWAKVPTERPPRPKIGDEGLTLRLADAGTYGIAPDHWPYENDMPRGAYPTRDTSLPAPYTIYEKHDVWAENSADLYELAIKERWKPATEISWNSIEALPEHTELALDQIFSNISEQQYNSMQVMGGWFQDISYGFHEVKLYLATQVFDQARHVEAFRKRALSNGGGLGVQTPSFFNRAVYAAFKFSEYVTYVNIIRTSFLLALCEQSDKLARSQADRQLFDNTANDLRRHLAFGIEHLKYYAQQRPDKRHNIHAWLDRGEMMMAADLKRDTPLREAFILAMGDTIVEGKEQLKALREAQLTKYLRTLEAATVPGRQILQTLREAIETP